MECLKKIAPILSFCVYLHQNNHIPSTHCWLKWEKRILNYWIVSRSVIFIRRAISVIQGEATRVFWLPHHPFRSLGTPLLVGFVYFLFRLRFYLKIKGFWLNVFVPEFKETTKDTDQDLWAKHRPKFQSYYSEKLLFPLPKFSPREYLHSSLSPSGLYSVIRVFLAYPSPHTRMHSLPIFPPSSFVSSAFKI